MYRNHIFHLHTRSKKIQKNSPKTPQIHSKNHSKISHKPNSNRDPEKALQKVLQSAKKYPTWSKMGSRKKVKAAPFFVLFDHWDPPGHPHGPQSLQKRSQEAPKPQFCFFLAPILSHFCYILDILFTHFCSRLPAT